MEIKAGTVTVLLDSAEVVKAIKPLIEAQLIGKITGMVLKDLEVKVIFGQPQEAVT